MGHWLWPMTHWPISISGQHAVAVDRTVASTPECPRRMARLQRSAGAWCVVVPAQLVKPPALGTASLPLLPLSCDINDCSFIDFEHSYFARYCSNRFEGRWCFILASSSSLLDVTVNEYSVLKLIHVRQSCPENTKVQWVSCSFVLWWSLPACWCCSPSRE